MSDRITLNLPYHWMILDGQPQIVLGGSTIDVDSATSYPTATIVTRGVGTTVPAGQAKSTGNTKTK